MTDGEEETSRYECEECGETFFTERQKNGHKSKHSNYHRKLRTDDGEDT